MTKFKQQYSNDKKPYKNTVKPAMNYQDFVLRVLSLVIIAAMILTALVVIAVCAVARKPDPVDTITFDEHEYVITFVDNKHVLGHKENCKYCNPEEQ